MAAMRRLALAALTVALGLTALLASSQSRKRQGPGAPPGVFDYYVLSLSWSPQYCSGPGGARDAIQCGEGRRFGFVVHGLWPQFERGYPAGCAGPRTVPPAIVDRMLPLMPSPRLIQHEWTMHGTCSGLEPGAYFDLVRKVHASVRIPEEYRTPLRQITVTPDSIRAKFASANPGMPTGSLRVLCGGRFLSEVRACLTKDLRLRACGASVRDTCRSPEIIMQPVR